MAFLQIFVSQQLLFLFSKRLDTMANVMDCDPGQTDLWMKEGSAQQQCNKMYFKGKMSARAKNASTLGALQ